MCQLKTAAGPSLGIDLDNWRLTDMDYADDIALFSPSSEDMSFVLPCTGLLCVAIMDRWLGTWPSVITIDWMHLTWPACADSKMSTGITMYETSLSNNKLNRAPSLSPWRSVDCAGSVTSSVCHPKVKSRNCTTSPRAQSAVLDDSGWTAFHKSSTSSSQRQFISPSIASTGVPFFVVCMTSGWPARALSKSSQTCHRQPSQINHSSDMSYKNKKDEPQLRYATETKPEERHHRYVTDNQARWTTAQTYHRQPSQMNHRSDLSHTTMPDEPQLRHITENQTRWTTAQICHRQSNHMKHSSDISHTTKPDEPQLRSVTHNQVTWTTVQICHRQPCQMTHSSDLSQMQLCWSHLYDPCMVTDHVAYEALIYHPDIWGRPCCPSPGIK